MSTVKPLTGITKDDQCYKPAVIKLYDFKKGGTDNVDQKIAAFSTKTKSPMWTRCSFSFVLDTARINASTLFAFATEVELGNDSVDFT